MTTSNRLRTVLAERGVAKRELARLIVRHLGLDGDRAALEKWERAVYRWTAEENPGGMEETNAELVARVLQLPADYFKEDAYLRELEAENRDLRQVAERLDRVERLLDELLKPEDER